VSGATHAKGDEASPAAPRRPRVWTRLFGLRAEAPLWARLGLGLACVLCVLLLWWFVTRGAAEERILGPTQLPSPSETFGSLHELWFDRALTRNTLVTLRRVLLGFVLACAVGIPLGVLCGCFAPVQAFLMPLTIFGRNIPIAALIPLTFALFEIGETQKILFIFIATVMFIVSDTAGSVRDVDQRYVDTAWTLGARRRQIIMKVLVPLSMPSVFNSLRMLFGLAFGYIMLAELVKMGDEAGGLGDIISQSQRRGLQEHVWLVLLVIPLVALAIDRILYAIQRSLFPYRYGGAGLLNRGLRRLVGAWEDLKALVLRPFRPAAEPATTRESPPDRERHS
jgi:ABC-type nitrate/sulfonate/bicarbonate transport system permease component